jgi:hypothetical protein
MTEDGKSPGPVSSANSGARWRTIGVILLALGIVGACLIYWLEKPPADLSDVMPATQDSKEATRSIEMNSGTAGLFMDQLMTDLQNPGTQALIIVVAAILLASGCFYVAQLSDHAGRR